MKHILLVLLFTVISLSCLNAQDKGIKYSYTKDKHEKDLLVEVRFTDSVFNVIARRIDILEFNPFSKMGYPFTVDPYQQFPVFNFKGKVLKDLLPAAYLDHYPKGSISLKDSLSHGDIDLYACTQNPLFTLLNYQLTMSSKKKVLGVIGSFNYFDRQGNELLQFLPYDVNVTDAYIAPKGRFIAHTYGVLREGGVSMKGGLRVIDQLGKRYYDIALDSAVIKQLTDTYLVVYSYAMAGETPGMKIQYFDLKHAYMYSQVYSEELAPKVTADYGEKAVFKISGRLISVDSDFSGEELKWKSFEKDWKVNGQ